MKKIFFLLSFITIAISAFSQDIITTTKGDSIRCKVTTITDNELTYKIYVGQDSTVRYMDRSAVFSIRYSNGLREYFNNTRTDDSDAESHSMAARGRKDATEYYYRYHGAKAATIVTSIIGSPIYGLIPAIVCSTTPPKDINLGYPDEKLMENKEYSDAYRKEAKHIKSKKVWNGYAIGSGTYAGAVLVGAIVLFALISAGGF